MLCYSCEKVASCPTFQTLYVMSKDFEIKDCRNYKSSTYKYKLIAQDDELMRFFYDYFTDNLGSLVHIDDKEIRRVIKQRLLDM